MIDAIEKEPNIGALYAPGAQTVATGRNTCIRELPRAAISRLRPKASVAIPACDKSLNQWPKAHIVPSLGPVISRRSDDSVRLASAG